MQIPIKHNPPGNVRGRENAVERAVVLATDPSVRLEMLPDHLLQASGIRLRRDEGGALLAGASVFEIVADYERRIIVERLEEFGGSQTEATAACTCLFRRQTEDQAAEYRDSQGRVAVALSHFLTLEGSSRHGLIDTVAPPPGPRAMPAAPADSSPGVPRR